MHYDGWMQARSQVLRFGGAQYIFKRAIFLFYCMFKTNYFINFQRLTEQHIASCLFSVWSHNICDCTGMLCVVGNQAGQEDFSAFLKFSKTMTFSGKKYPHKTKNICLVMRFSPETTKKAKKDSPMLQDIFLTTRQCFMPVCCLWFSKNFVWCLPNALLTFLKKRNNIWHKQQNWTNFNRTSIYSEDTGTKEILTNSSKESQQCTRLYTV